MTVIMYGSGSLTYKKYKNNIAHIHWLNNSSSSPVKRSISTDIALRVKVCY